MKDLTQFKYWHSPVLTEHKDLPEEFDAYAVGWMGNKVDVSGPFPEELFNALKFASKKNSVDQGALGYHTCEICNKYDDRGEFFIKHNNIYYVLPQMVFHYIKEHSYLPPKQFINALSEWWSEHQNK